MQHPELLLFFFIIAFVYSSVGFGGGSSYLAILALYALPFKELRLIALICNIIVVTGGTLVFIKHRQVDWKKIIPLIVVSIPMAYLGARLKISEQVFFIVLGCSLIVAAILLWIKTRADKESKPVQADNGQFIKHGFLGGIIGFLSGMVGIGGGIFLSPILNLSKWDTAKKIAATASVFILVNSLSGIAGQLQDLPQDVDYTRIAFLGLAVLVGGQIGSRMSAVKFNMLAIRRITAALVFFAGMEVLFKHIPPKSPFRGLSASNICPHR
jgi:uncharacterized membrane protein YfcA